MYLHNANNSATIIREVPNPSDHISSVEEALRVSRHQHEQAHGRHGRPSDKAISEPSIEEEEIKAPTAISKTMSCRKTIKHKNTHNV